MTRPCPRCKEEKPQDAYPPSAWRKGPGNPCRACSSTERKARRLENPEVHRQRDRQRYLTYRHASVRAYGYMKAYGLTVEQVDAMFKRQYGRCLGCQGELKVGGKRGERFNVDHNHETGEVRGLLCSPCNRSLGLLKEDPSTLRRLISYLSYDRTKTCVYIIGSLRNPIVPQVGNRLRAEGFDAIDDWYGAGFEADDMWQAYEGIRGRSYAEALGGRAAQNVFLFDRSFLDMADAAVMIAPGGRSAHIELGYFLGSGKPGFILSQDEPERFEVMPNFATEICYSVDALVAGLRGVSRELGLANGV